MSDFRESPAIWYMIESVKSTRYFVLYIFSSIGVPGNFNIGFSRLEYSRTDGSFFNYIASESGMSLVRERSNRCDDGRFKMNRCRALIILEIFNRLVLTPFAKSVHIIGHINTDIPKNRGR